jgi:hypothetical protein
MEAQPPMGLKGDSGQDIGQKAGCGGSGCRAAGRMGRHIRSSTSKHARMLSPAPGAHATTLTYNTARAAISAAAHPCR